MTGRVIPWVFHPTKRGRQLKGFRRAWVQACLDAGVPGRILHDLRRTAVQNLERAGVPRSVAMKMVGHKTESVYRCYAIAARKVPRFGNETGLSWNCACQPCSSGRTRGSRQCVSHVRRRAPTTRRYQHDIPVRGRVAVCHRRGSNGGTSWLSRVWRTNPAEPPRAQVASNTADWFKHLRDSGVTRLWLASFHRSDAKLPAHIAVAFAGFSHWGILAQQQETASWWHGHEELINAPSRTARAAAPRPLPKAKGNRIWRVTYEGSVAGKPSPTLTGLTEAREQLLNAVGSAIEFADNARVEVWRKWLEEARAQLDSNMPQPRFHRDMLPENGYDLESRQLLAASSSAWVFGGMGSWNDMSFDGALKQQYDRVTSALYTAVVKAIVAATNIFNPSVTQAGERPA